MYGERECNDQSREEKEPSIKSSGQGEAKNAQKGRGQTRREGLKPKSRGGERKKHISLLVGY